jgi:hypothetical protein
MQVGMQLIGMAHKLAEQNSQESESTETASLH